MRQVEIAQAYDTRETGRHGRARFMLLRQDSFPLDYHDTAVSAGYADGDTLIERNLTLGALRPFYEAAVRKAVKSARTGNLPPLLWWLQNGQSSDVKAMMVTAFPQSDGGRRWTGYRLALSADPDGDETTFHLQLFRRGRKTGTAVFSGQEAPNVRRAAFEAPARERPAEREPAFADA